MEIKVEFDLNQLELVVDYIATHNTNFQGQHDLVRQKIYQTIDELAAGWPNVDQIGTLDFMLVIRDFYPEGLDHDYNTMYIDILIDLSISNKSNFYFNSLLYRKTGDQCVRFNDEE